MVDNLLPLTNVDGISYWYPEDAGNGDYANWNTKVGLVEETWSNRGFWNEQSTTSGHAINKTGNVSGNKTAADVCAPYYLGKFAATPESIDQTTNNHRPMTNKLLRNGQLLIERNNHTYTLTGTEVK